MFTLELTTESNHITTLTYDDEKELKAAYAKALADRFVQYVMFWRN